MLIQDGGQLLILAVGIFHDTIYVWGHMRDNIQLKTGKVIHFWKEEILQNMIFGEYLRFT